MPQLESRLGVLVREERLQDLGHHHPGTATNENTPHLRPLNIEGLREEDRKRQAGTRSGMLLNEDFPQLWAPLQGLYIGP